MNTRFVGIGRLGVAWRSYRRPNERRLSTTVIGLPFSADPAEWDRFRQVRVGPLLFSWWL